MKEYYFLIYPAIPVNNPKADKQQISFVESRVLKISVSYCEPPYNIPRQKEVENRKYFTKDAH
eukprot:snap_masked-scaffold_2-processed-gene-21.3-mRNA-1 protein AED:1.00 eAED:1.00 QI:0/-1/0/0/-1/1/1/0/62